MGLTGIRPFSLLLVLLILVLLFGSSRLKNLGKDLGEAIRGFKEGLQGTDPHLRTKKEEALPPTSSHSSQEKHD